MKAVCITQPRVYLFCGHLSRVSARALLTLDGPEPRAVAQFLFPSSLPLPIPLAGYELSVRDHQ